MQSKSIVVSNAVENRIGYIEYKLQLHKPSYSQNFDLHNHTPGYMINALKLLHYLKEKQSVRDRIITRISASSTLSVYPPVPRTGISSLHKRHNY